MGIKEQQALTRYSEQLAQLVVRLSSFFEGANPSIDNELKVLRGHLAGKPNFTLAEVSINKITPMLMEGNHQISERIKSNVSDLKKQLKAVQQLDGASDILTKETAKLLGTLTLPTRTLTELFKHQSSAVGLLHTAITGEVGLSNESFSDTATDASVDGELTSADSIKAEILAELYQLVEVYTRKKPQNAELLSLKSSLQQGVDDKQLLESCLIVIRLIINESMLDASMSGKLVQNFAATVDETHQQVDKTISVSQQAFEKNAQHQTELQGILGDLDHDIDSTKDVEELKQKAHFHIDKMRTEIASNKEAGEKDQQVLMELLSDMQKQLQSLQIRTESYKQRLVEQRATIYTDPLTKIPNRLAYNEKITKALNQARANGQPLCLSVIDIDHFKTVNDQYGHAAGDRTLQVVAKHLQKLTQPNEFLARWGGEEFVLLMHNQSFEGLHQRLENLRLSLSELPFKFKQTPVKITASFGACCFAQNETPQQAFERADKALYLAKSEGRNCVKVN